MGYDTQTQSLSLLRYDEHLALAADFLDPDDHMEMTADLQVGRSCLLRPITACEIASLGALWQSVPVPESLAKFHLTLQLKRQLEAQFPDDTIKQSRLLAIISPLENDTIDHPVPWMLAYKMLTPERRAVFYQAVLLAAELFT